MDADRFERRTERQRQCLRLVARGLEVKEIARELDLSPTAVIERLRGARRVLDVETSREAARLLSAHERPGINTRHVDMPTPVADVPYPLPSNALSEDGIGEPLRLQEMALPFVALDPEPAVETNNWPWPWPWPWRRKGARSNELTPSQRLLVSGGLTIAIAMGAAIMLIAIVLLMDLLIRISRHGG